MYTFGLFFEGLKGGSWLNWAGFVVTTAVNLYIHYIVLFFIAAEAFFVAIYTAIFLLQLFKLLPTSLTSKFIDSKKSLKNFIFALTSFVLAGVLYLPWLPHFFTFLNTPDYGLSRGTRHLGLSDLFTIFSATGLGSYSWDVWLTIVLVVVGYIFSFKNWPRSGLLLLSLWGFPMAVIFLLPGGNTFINNYRYLIFLVPSLICLSAVALLGIIDTIITFLKNHWPIKIKANILRFALIVILLGITTTLSIQILATFVYPENKDANGEAAIYIQAHSQPGDAVINIDTPANYRPLLFLDYYMAKFNPKMPFTPTSTPMSAAVLSQFNVQEVKRIWVALQFPLANFDLSQLLRYPPTDFKLNCFDRTCLLLDQHPEKAKPLQRFQQAMSEYENYYPEVYVPADLTAQYLLNPHRFDQNTNLLAKLVKIFRLLGRPASSVINLRWKLDIITWFPFAIRVSRACVFRRHTAIIQLLPIFPLFRAINQPTTLRLLLT